MAKKAKKIKPIKCKFCGKLIADSTTYGSHLESIHPDMIPDNMSGDQFFYYMRTGKDHGTCPMCKTKTEWNPTTKRYNYFCDNPKCKDAYVKMFKKRMIGKYGKTTLLNDVQQQKIMLANRSISGKYVWSDRTIEIPYTGSYELSFLEFLDNVLEFDPTDIIAPSPHTYYYVYEGKRRFYIPDIFIPSLQLEIEIKDGGANPNKHHKIIAVDKEKERLKDDVMRTISNFNYLKVVDKQNIRFIEYLEIARDNFQNNIDQKIFMP